MEEGEAHIVITMILVFIVYFLPTTISEYRHAKKADTIFGFNFVLGWFPLAWIALMVWSMVGEKKKGE